MPINLDTLDYEDRDQSPTRTEDSAERGLAEVDPCTQDPVSYHDLGKSETASDFGDLADEGAGHRG